MSQICLKTIGKCVFEECSGKERTPSCARVYCAATLVMCKTFLSKSLLLMCLMLMCVIPPDTHFNAPFPRWHNLYLDCQLTCNQIPFFYAMRCVMLISLSVALSFSLLVSLSLSLCGSFRLPLNHTHTQLTHKQAQTLKGMNPNALTQLH